MLVLDEADKSTDWFHKFLKEGRNTEMLWFMHVNGFRFNNAVGLWPLLDLLSHHPKVLRAHAAQLRCAIGAVRGARGAVRPLLLGQPGEQRAVRISHPLRQGEDRGPTHGRARPPF